jgi:hypothetical protein
MKRILFNIVVIAMAAGGSVYPRSLRAQPQCSASGAPDNCSVPANASMTAGRVVRLEMSAGSTLLTAPTTADFDAGFNSSTGPTLTVSANAPWLLHIRAAAATWAATNTAPDAPAWVAKPAGDLKWSTDLNGSFAPLTTTDANLFAGSATSGSGNTLFFQTRYDWTTDTPGNYSLAIVLTLTSP